jgi:hypothetical protein
MPLDYSPPPCLKVIDSINDHFVLLVTTVPVQSQINELANDLKVTLVHRNLMEPALHVVGELTPMQ